MRSQLLQHSPIGLGLDIGLGKLGLGKLGYGKLSYTKVVCEFCIEVENSVGHILCVGIDYGNYFYASATDRCAGGIMFSSCPCVHPCMRPCVLLFVLNNPVNTIPQKVFDGISLNFQNKFTLGK